LLRAQGRPPTRLLQSCELKALPQQAADRAAAEAVRILTAETNQNRQQEHLLETKWNVGVPPPAPEASQNAAGPYVVAMNRAVAARTSYELKAVGLQDKADEVQKQARVVAKQAVAYQSAGRSDMGNKLMAQAEGMINGANAADEEAQHWHGLADDINQNTPK